jgi:hypothetical protein
MTVPFIPDQALERQAMELLAQYEAQEGAIAQPPIPIDLIIEILLNIDIDWTPLELPNSGERVLAAIELTATRRRILMNELERSYFDVFIGTAAYSKAHEVGHAVLHLPKTPDLQPALWSSTPIVLCRSDQQSRQEIQAERFAAYLLMPEPLLRVTVGGQRITSWPQMYDLCNAFGVSISAMRYRLEALNLCYVDANGNVHASREEATGQRGLFS